jgi:predicted dithiol-disulfide oxidoreductase (DUF899 family)
MKIETMEMKGSRHLNRDNLLDLTPKGRDENPDSTMDWVRRHDEYENGAKRKD